MIHVPLRTLGSLVDPVETWSPERDSPDDSFIYIDLSGVDQEAKAITGARELPCAEAPSRARQLVAAGDVLVSTVRPNLNAVAPVPSEFGGATASTGFCVLRPRPEALDGAYLLHWVRSPRFVSEMVRRATGASYPAVSDRIILHSSLPLPALAEQRRIAEVLDQADALRAKRRATLALLDTLTQCIFLDMFGDPAANPKGWRCRTLGDVFEIARGGSPRPIDDYVTEAPAGINWISISDASAGSKYITTTRRRIRQEGARRSRAVSRGDLLLTNSMSFGRPYIMRTSGCIHDGWLVLSPRTDDVEAEFFYSLLSSRSVFAEFARRAAGVTVKNLNIELVKEVVIPVPPVSNQRDFARRIAEIDRMIGAHVSSLLVLDRLFASLQDRAFRGVI